MSTTVAIARHGRTPWHADHRYVGSSDIPIDEVGRRQARELAGWAREFAPSALFCSPLRRTRQTMEPVVAAVGVEATVDPRLREVDFGIGEGRTLDEVDEEVARRFRADPVTDHFPGGEDPREAAERAVEWVVEVGRGHEGRRVLAVAHGTLIRLVLCSAMGIPLKEYRRAMPAVRSVGLTLLRVDGERIAMEGFNVPPVPGRMD
ncbi:probable phosphoglycerate mutase [Marinactinospora thermotolerans DSM 45154]|uniref:Probable phosphoglycerate mutase n=1 Tax=Marinactinospora thermotolerans DSM 45154 TaxID=1122192 RepID=A0A1T4SYU3_9ACTN|nr:histidine phosphatase family protein [Marinactinospora thermotolerans]SKA33111.1 probable phosphoglycerate mutase [Marinactinospora thermotolerans DSM 45154]